MNFQLEESPFGFHSVKPLPSEQELRAHYSQKYYQIEKGSYQHRYSEDELRYFDIEAEVALHIYQNFSTINSPQQRMLDIGTGEGFFANHFLNNKWGVTCCDYSNEGVKRHNPSLLKNLIKGNIFETLDKKIASNERYDFVNLKNVLEHVRDPIDLLGNIKCILQKDALVRIEVPNDYSTFQNFLLQSEFTVNTWFTPPEHLHYFTFQSLSNLVESLGYKVKLLMADFPIELYLLNEHSNYVFDKSKGKSAHLARVRANNYVFDQGIENYINYFKANAQANLGRQAILYASI